MWLNPRSLLGFQLPYRHFAPLTVIDDLNFCPVMPLRSTKWLEPFSRPSLLLLFSGSDRFGKNTITSPFALLSFSHSNFGCWPFSPAHLSNRCSFFLLLSAAPPGGCKHLAKTDIHLLVISCFLMDKISTQGTCEPLQFVAPYFNRYVTKNLLMVKYYGNLRSEDVLSHLSNQTHNSC